MLISFVLLIVPNAGIAVLSEFPDLLFCREVLISFNAEWMSVSCFSGEVI